MSADVEAVFHFDDNRKIFDGYRPAHLICENYLTTGLHHYYNSDNSNEELKGTIEFISPEAYPNSLWIGKSLDMYEGSEKIGYAEIVNIYNPILEKHRKCFFKSKITWYSQADGGRKNIPSVGIRYCPIIKIDICKNSWSIDFICPDFTKTDIIQFSFLVDDAPKDIIEVGKNYDLYEGGRKVALVSVVDRIYE